MLRRIIVRAALVLVLLAGPTSLAFPSEDPPEGQMQCRDALHCPDLVIDQTYLANHQQTTRTFSETSCSVQEGTATPGTHELLLVTIATPNVGTQDLVIGRPTQNPIFFEWGQCHGHWHYIAYAELRLWTPKGYHNWQQLRLQHPTLTSDQIMERHPEVLRDFVAGSKVGFCVINVSGGYVSRMPLLYQPSGHRPSCSDMGITVGYADVYGMGTEGQWIIIDDVRPGLYMLEAEVNADRLFDELEFYENAKAVQVRIT